MAMKEGNALVKGHFQCGVKVKPKLRIKTGNLEQLEDDESKLYRGV